MKRILLIGDTHGQVEKYRRILSKLKDEYDMSVALGDFGFKNEYDWFEKMSFKSNYPKPNYDDYILPGNHDYYTMINSDNCPKNILKKFGYLEDLDIFYISGALSIDKVYRTEGRTWFADEEMSIMELYDMIDLYTKIKPKTVISHTLPRVVVNKLMHYKIDYPCRTGQAMDSMLSIHKPENWYCGHFHESTEYDFEDTKFRILDELEPLIIER